MLLVRLPGDELGAVVVDEDPADEVGGRIDDEDVAAELGGEVVAAVHRRRADGGEGGERPSGRSTPVW